MYQKVLAMQKGVNPYDINGWCYTSTANAGSHLARWLKESASVLPCADCSGLNAFFNDPEVQKLLHIHTEKIPVDWNMCLPDASNYTCFAQGSYPYYPLLISAGYRILVYSGNADPCVPTQGTLDWLNRLKVDAHLSDIETWRSWFTAGNPPDNQRQNAGQYWKIDGITFVAVKGAGHMVPQTKPKEAFEMLTAFFKNQDLPAQ